jgi:membrane-bound lytic murein transglycosylase A
MSGDRQTLTFADLPGWAVDDHAAALSVYLAGRPDGWPVPAPGQDSRVFLETNFVPTLITDANPPLFTGYFEPELDGSLTRSARYCHALYRLPPGTPPFPPRSDIESGALAGQGLELVWVDDPVALYFLHVQGSGRIRLTDGGTLRVGYAGRNGHGYQSLGRLLVARGDIPADRISADALMDWLRADPVRGQAAMDLNPSYIFFRPLDLNPDQGPLGAQQVPLTPLRSCAVDPAHHALGTPMWVETTGHARLMIAQDVGGAIKGAQRADLYFGTGADAGLAAGRLAAPGRLLALLPKP